MRRALVGAGIIAVVVLAFTRGWRDGRTTLDGNGVVLYVDIGLHYWRSTGHLPYWVPDLWTGGPIWALAPILPVLTLLPLARLVGAETSVRLLTVLFQIIGGWGVMVLARSLWHDDGREGPRPAQTGCTPVDVAAVVAGCLYALHPIVISHGTLFGHETTIAVLAVAPWLVWSVRRALRGDGAPWIVLAGGLAAVAILEQAEHAYALVIICALMAVAQLTLAVRAQGRAAVRAMAVRVLGVVAVLSGLLAHWLVPLRALTGAFILSPADVVTTSFTNGIGAQVANEPGAFVTRSPGLANVVTYAHPDLVRAGSFYLGWVWLAGAAVGLAVLAWRPRRDRDATMCALLLASALSLWMSTAATPLARSGPGIRHQWVALAVIGGLGGLCLGAYVRRLVAGWVTVVLAVVAVVLLFAAPYVTPFLVLQKLIPLAGNLRLPRLYPLAALGLSMSAAYPLTLMARLPRPAGPGNRAFRQVAAAAAGTALLGAAIVDVWPYRDFYRTRPPAGVPAYAAAFGQLPPTGRLITEQFGDPRIVDDLYRSGHLLATGWPHPLAGRDVWPLVVTPQEAAPSGYRDQAASLAGVTAQVVEHQIVPADPQTPAELAALTKTVSDPRHPAPDLGPHAVEVAPIDGLPLVRSYDEAVVVPASAPSTELAVGLLADHVSVVRGDRAATRALGTVAVAPTPQGGGCSSFGAEAGGAYLGSRLAVACALHRWVGQYVGLNETYLGAGAGAVFNAADDLRGVALWLLGPSAGIHLDIRPLRANGSLGATVATAGPGPLDRNGLVPFVFSPPLPAGQYGFEATCGSCPANGNAAPRLVFTQGTPGNLVRADRLATDLVAAFAPIYPPGPTAAPSTATVATTGHGAGRWDIDVHADRPQLVVVAESDFPGWRATVDGRGAAVVEADSAFVGVAVPAGTHHLSLRYHAPGVALGDWISGLTVLVGAAVAGNKPLRRWWRRIRRGHRSGPIPAGGG